MLTDRDRLTLEARALRHAPAHMLTQHFAERLEELARRVEATTQESLQVGGDDAEASTDT